MDTALSTPVGQLLGGRYHVDSRIARGGMATVYLGTDTRLDRVVALKIAHPELSDDAEFVRRFIGEARSAARLSSPNVVAIFDQGSDKRLHYIAMEYVPGRTLRQLLNERGRLGVREALDIMSGVLTGLAAAHEAGFAHRDVKPENVLLTTSGVVKVADFGLARSVAGAVQTKGGMIIGTAAYLAPEQVSGGTSDGRTDVYAAGIMLFELLTGIQPHTGESPLALAYKHVHEVVPAPSSIVGGLSAAVDALVAMTTSRDPDLRPANATQFLRAIGEVRDGQPLPGTAPHYGSGPQPGLPYQGSGPQSGLPYHGSGPQPGLAPAGDGRYDSSPPHASSGPYQVPAALPDSAYQATAGQAGSGQHWTPGPDSGSHPYRAQEAEPLGPGQDADGTRHMDAIDYDFDDDSPERHWDPEPGAVGASALPSLSPQTSALLPAPLADPQSMVNHTLVVSQAGELAPYVGPPGPQHGQSFGGRSGRRRPPGQPRESWLRFSGRLMYVAAGLAVVLVIALVAWWFSSGQYQQVPTLRALTFTAAKTVLKNEGLQFRVGGTHHNPLPKGDVIRSSPAKGSRVAGGTVVTMILSSGPHMRVVPNVSGQTEAAAKAYLTEHHLTPGEDKPAVSSTVPAGDVIGTIPRAYSRIPQFKKVRLIISEGPGLPDFVGMQVTDAQAAAAAGGYTINPVPDAKGSEPANTITRQSPSPNTPITPSEVVTVHYSPGPPTIPVPDVRGLTITQGKVTLHGAGFRIAVDHQGPGGTIGSYSPTGDQPKGTVITLYTGVFSGL